MPATVTCPTCNKPLRVPDELLGKMVRCPGCQGTFPATASAPTPPAPPPPPPAPAVPPQIQTNPTPAPPPQFQANPAPTSEPPNLDFDPSPAPRFEQSFQAIGDRSQALALVKGPSMALMIVSGVLGGLALLLFLIGAGFYLFMASASSGSGGTSGGSNAFPNDAFASSAVSLGVSFVELLIDAAWAVAVFMGAQRMQQLRTYPFAMTSAILAMLPLSGCVCGLCTFIPWFVSLGFGIWALVILCKPEVKAAFQ